MKLYTFTLSLVFVFPEHWTIARAPSFLGFEKKSSEKQKVVKFSWCDTPWLGGNGNTHYPGKWFVSVSVRTEERVQPFVPYCICQFPNLINYHPQTLRLSTINYQQLVDKTMVLSKVGWLVQIIINSRYLITRLISDKNAVINKDPSYSFS
jgi:hypothetical protein